MAKKEDIIFYPGGEQIYVNGLLYFPNYISEEEEKLLMEIIDKNNWRKDIRRRQQHYGMLYYHTRHNLSEI